MNRRGFLGALICFPLAAKTSERVETHWEVESTDTADLWYLLPDQPRRHYRVSFVLADGRKVPFNSIYGKT